MRRSRCAHIESGLSFLIHFNQPSVGPYAGKGRTPAINVRNINAVREARQASGSKMVWLSPIALPLLMTFGALGLITYMQASNALDHTRRNHRPYGVSLLYSLVVLIVLGRSTSSTPACTY